MIPLFVLTSTLLVVLVSSTSDDQPFCVMVALYRPAPYTNWGRAGTAGSRFARDGIEGASAGGSNYPENGLVKPPRRDTQRALCPAGISDERRRSA
jgi:hypothetical protein